MVSTDNLIWVGTVVAMFAIEQLNVRQIVNRKLESLKLQVADRMEEAPVWLRAIAPDALQAMDLIFKRSLDNLALAPKWKDAVLSVVSVLTDGKVDERESQLAYEWLEKNFQPSASLSNIAKEAVSTKAANTVNRVLQII